MPPPDIPHPRSVRYWCVVGVALFGAVSYDLVSGPDRLDEEQLTTYTGPCLGRCALPEVPVAGVLAAIATARSSTRFAPARLAARAEAVLRKYGTYIDRHRGWIPASVIAVRIDVETGGNASTGPIGAGRETGLLQLWLCRPPQCTPDCGYTEAQAKDPELNLKCMLPMWRGVIGRVESQFRRAGLFATRSGAEYWACMQLLTMIGEGAFAALVRASKARPGTEYSDLRRYVENAGEKLVALRGYFGQQEADVVARRVVTAGLMTEAAQQLGGLGGGGWLWLLAAFGAAWWARTKGWI